MLKKIDKSHSKTDLIELINTIDIPVIFSHSHNKHDIQQKLEELIKESKDIIFDANVYNISTLKDLQIYVSNPNPKKILSVKEKSTVMQICREICKYCKNNFHIQKTNYKSVQELHDDALYIVQFGDLPSVRRSCKLLNNNQQRIQEYIPIISPQVRKLLEDKMKSKKVYSHGLEKSYGNFTIKFD